MLFVAKPLAPNPPGNLLDWVIFGHEVLQSGFDVKDVSKKIKISKIGSILFC